MSLTTLNELQKQADVLRKISALFTSYAAKVSKMRDLAINNIGTHRNPFQVKTDSEDRNYHLPRTEAVEEAFQKAIAPLEDHILATMEINFHAEAKRAMMQAEAIEARIAASITVPEPLP